MSIIELKPLDRDFAAKKLLKERLENPEKIAVVIIIEQHEDGTRRLVTSPGSNEEKALLKCFFDHWILSWFADTTIVEAP